MYKEDDKGFKNPIGSQDEFNERLDRFMDRGEEEALFALLERYPDFMVQYAGELEKEWGW